MGWFSVFCFARLSELHKTVHTYSEKKREESINYLKETGFISQTPLEITLKSKKY